MDSAGEFHTRDTASSYKKRPDVTTVGTDLLPPSWTTTAAVSGTSFRSVMGSMQRRISEFVGATTTGGGNVDLDHTEPTDQQSPHSYLLGKELHRSGLLHPAAYYGSLMNSLPPSGPIYPARSVLSSTRQDFQPTMSPFYPTADTFQPHTPDSIRATTVGLSSMPFPATLPSSFGISLNRIGGRTPSTREGPAKYDKHMSSRPNVRPADPNSFDRSLLPAENSGGFIFPLPSNNGAVPHIDMKTHLPASSLELLFPVNLQSSPSKESLKSSAASTSVVTTRTGTGDSSALDDSIGTLLSSTTSIVSAKVPANSVDRARRKEKQKEGESRPSGLSLSKPASEAGDNSPNTEFSPSRSSSLESEFRVDLSTQPTLFKPGQAQITQSRLSPSFGIDEGNNTPTATPMGTPTAPIRRLPTSATTASLRTVERADGDIEKQNESDIPTGLPVAGQGHIRWRSPLRVEQRQSANFGYEESLEGLLDSDSSNEATPLLGGQPPLHYQLTKKEHMSRSLVLLFKTRLKKELKHMPEHGLTALKSIPAVLLGCLLNILDGVSYGMIMFPTTGVFSELGPMGVSLFFVSTIISQLVYTFGGSGFAGGNGSMMIEVVPFFRIMANDIAEKMGDDDPFSVIATTLFAYIFSSLLTGVTFFLLGALKLGGLIGFFPRHILVGCIGGIGAFLLQTGVTVSLRISEDELDFSFATLKYIFEIHNFVLWAIPLILAVTLRVITHKFHHQLIFPLYFLLVPAAFYVVAAIGKFNLEDLRKSRWIFDVSSADEPWFKYYSYVDFTRVDYGVLWSTLPTQLALLFFNVLHPPLNVPALSVSLNNDVDTNKELVAHGYSNIISGFFCSVPNYLVYVNTVLFYRVGGDTRIAGFLLAVATTALLVIGPWPIAYLPVMVVGALVYVLGIDLVKEALWDNRQRASLSEYITIISIMVMMTVWDFVTGVLFGIVVCCIFFVIQNSQMRCIRAMYTGDFAMSAVRRPSLQRAYIREVSRQTTILRLQGFLFFGTITQVEETIRSTIETPSWQQQPVQFLVLDLSLVGGIDMSSAEAFVRIHRLLSSKCVVLVFCGFEGGSAIGKALSSVKVLGQPGVEIFSSFTDAIEWTENAYLHAWFKSQKIEVNTAFLSIPSQRDTELEYNQVVGSFFRSPRRSQIWDAGARTIGIEILATPGPDLSTEPCNTLRKAFSSHDDLDPAIFESIGKYMELIIAATGTILWQQGEQPNGIYVIESGILRASYKFANPMQRFEESMVPGTLAGELSTLAESPRNATVTVEHGPARLWMLSRVNLKRLQTEEPELARVFIQLVLKAAKMDYDILLAALASRQ